MVAFSTSSLFFNEHLRQFPLGCTGLNSYKFSRIRLPFWRSYGGIVILLYPPLSVRLYRNLNIPKIYKIYFLISASFVASKRCLTIGKMEAKRKLLTWIFPPSHNIVTSWNLGFCDNSKTSSKQTQGIPQIVLLVRDSVFKSIITSIYSFPERFTL